MSRSRCDEWGSPDQGSIRPASPATDARGTPAGAIMPELDSFSKLTILLLLGLYCGWSVAKPGPRPKYRPWMRNVPQPLVSWISGTAIKKEVYGVSVAEKRRLSLSDNIRMSFGESFKMSKCP